MKKTEIFSREVSIDNQSLEEVNDYVKFIKSEFDDFLRKNKYTNAVILNEHFTMCYGHYDDCCSFVKYEITFERDMTQKEKKQEQKIKEKEEARKLSLEEQEKKLLKKLKKKYPNEN